MSTTTNLDTLKINYLTQSQYDSALNNNQINENELYFTPGTGPVELTQAQYDALSTAEKNNGNVYYITDGIVYPGLSEFLNILYPIGAEYMTSTNTNPGSWLGGTWSLISKELAYKWVTTGCTFDSTNTQNGSFAACLEGHTIEFRFNWQNKVAITDDSTTIGTLDLSAVGLTDGTNTGHTEYGVAYADGLNAIGMLNFNFAGNNGTLSTIDWVTTATSKPTTTGQTCLATIVYVVSSSANGLLDSFCNRFVWKRTA